MKFANKEDDFDNFKRQRNEIVEILKEKERKKTICYEALLKENRSNSKKIWEVMKTFINMGNNSLLFSGLDISKNIYEIKDSMNGYFINSIHEILQIQKEILH